MVDDILDYIVSYDDIRAACGLSSEELSDTELALTYYKNSLSISLASVSGIYPPSVVEQTLEEMFNSLTDASPMYVAIQQYSTCIVAHEACAALSLKALKTITDGKASMTRFSAESTFKDALNSTSQCMQKWLYFIKDLLGETSTETTYMSAVKPAYDPITGA